nr:hypothetical protein [Tanacetum cinerariifolium]
ILKDALDITPTNDNNPFMAPPLSDTVIEYVNTLGYPSKTARFNKPRHLVLQIMWDSRGKKKTTHMLIPSIRFTKLIIHHLKTKHNIHLRSGSPLHYSHDESVLNTLRYVGKDDREIFEVQGKEKVIEEQVAHDLPTLQTPKNKSPVDQSIFQRRTPMPDKSSGPVESLFLDAELALTDKFTITDYPNVQENLKLSSEDLVIPEEPTSSTGTLSSLQNLNKELSFIDQFFWRSNRKKNQGKPMHKQRFGQWSRSLFIKVPPRFLQ